MSTISPQSTPISLPADRAPAVAEDIAIKIVPRARDLGDFVVKRVLPHPQRQMVGPFIFFDQMGPAQFRPGQAVDVRPHPHIGLATVTYLLSGSLQHKDSLGVTQDITPGALNFMVAGRGITHSERTPPAPRAQGQHLFGLQTWMALPKAKEEMDPAFLHTPAENLPILTDKGLELKVILGRAYGATAPVQGHSDTLYVDATLAPGARLPLPDDHEDRAVYVVEGHLNIDQETIGAGQMLVFKEGRPVAVTAGPNGARLLLCGGEVADGPRYISWNFVSSSKDRLEDAIAAWKAADWDNGPFKLPPHDQNEFIPL